MKKLGLLFIGLLIVVPGCGGKKKNGRKKTGQNHREVVNNQKKDHKTVSQEVDISLADNKIKSYFDDSLEEFSFENGDSILVPTQNAIDTTIGHNVLQKGNVVDDYSWTSLSQDAVKQDFDNVYFDFDKYNIKGTEKEKAVRDAQIAKEKIETERLAGKSVHVVIAGNSDDSAGSAAYNVALSEKRALALADTFKEQGVPQENIKIVGRGYEVPVMVDGKPLKGSRDEQWLNRRDEVHLTMAS